MAMHRRRIFELRERVAGQTVGAGLQDDELGCERLEVTQLARRYILGLQLLHIEQSVQFD